MRGIDETLHLLADLCRRALDGAEVADIAFVTAVEEMELATNCDAAAEALFAAVAVPCLLRRSLHRALFRLALDPLYCLGVSSADQALGWGEATARRGRQYILWGPNARRFATELLREEHDLVQETLDGLALENAASGDTPTP